MADDSELISQNEIEELLNQAKGAAAQASPRQSPAGQAGGKTDPAPVGQDEIESVLGGAQAGAAAAATPTPAAAPVATATARQPAPQANPVTPDTSASDDIQLLLDQAEEAIATVTELDASRADVTPFKFQDFTGSPPSTEKATIDLLRDIELSLKIELGRTQMELEDVLKLRRGSVVALDKLAGDPVDVYVNGRLVARGEVLVLNDNFCVRVAELISGDD